MSLPLVFDIALGLIFIYLIASLLASEIQEIIATLLQWRAEHLKRSIEILISGDNRDTLTDQRFVDRLYENPLIRSLNQEAKGILAVSFRRTGQAIGDIYRLVTRTRNVFGSLRSGPSYLPAETFATALLQQLQLEPILQQLQNRSLTDYLTDKLARVEAILESLRNSVGDDTLLAAEFADLQSSLTQLTAQTRRTALGEPTDSIESRYQTIAAQIRQFIEATETVLQPDDPPQAIIRQRLAYLKRDIDLHNPAPTIADAVALLFDPAQARNLPPELAQLVAVLRESNLDIPETLTQNLTALAQRAQSKVGTAEAGVLQLQKEVEAWFDRSMERASGVYRRNAKGIGILIGIAIAIATNADTFHMVNRLSKDTLLRSAITQAADQVAAQTGADLARPTEVTTDLQAVRDAVDRSLNGLLLPVGWDQINVDQQQAESQGWPPQLRRILGWLVTGVALSMGASFWYDLLGRVIRVRNAGQSSSTDK